jgi:hypothetical protein
MGRKWRHFLNMRLHASTAAPTSAQVPSTTPYYSVVVRSNYAIWSSLMSGGMHQPAADRYCISTVVDATEWH